LLFVNIANIQRHPEFWDDPDIFRPRRFLSGQSASTHRLAYMPFGAGSRVCLGSHFAMLESTLLLGIIARNFRLSPIDRDAIEPEIVLTLRPKGGLRVRVTER
jgi:cytochrome P450